DYSSSYQRGVQGIKGAHHPYNVVGDVTTPAVDENVVPYYKGAWGEIRRLGKHETLVAEVSFKRRRYR
ncbi:MAG: hypothetical protein ACLFSI_08360, partial [Halorhodospira sp.]